VVCGYGIYRSETAVDLRVASGLPSDSYILNRRCLEGRNDVPPSLGPSQDPRPRVGLTPDRVPSPSPPPSAAPSIVGRSLRSTDVVVQSSCLPHLTQKDVPPPVVYHYPRQNARSFGAGQVGGASARSNFEAGQCVSMVQRITVIRLRAADVNSKETTPVPPPARPATSVHRPLESARETTRDPCPLIEQSRRASSKNRSTRTANVRSNPLTLRVHGTE
jgi:hypothetical protein